MNNTEVHVSADKIKRRKKIMKATKYIVLILLTLLIAIYLILSLINNGGSFTVILKDSLAVGDRVVVYEYKDDFDYKRKLYADPLDYMDNISIDWLPSDIDTESDGPHNGENYIAYSFYVENKGEETVNYWSEIFIDDVIRNIDEAIRIMIIQNGEKTVYAKINSRTGEPEKETIAFYNEKKAVVRPRKDFAPGDIDRYTIVIWLEGDDEDCVNALIGGEIKLHMEITDEIVD